MADKKPLINRATDTAVQAILLGIAVMIGLALLTAVVHFYTVSAILVMIILGLLIAIIRMRRRDAP